LLYKGQEAQMINAAKRGKPDDLGNIVNKLT
jgi:hypothetical protein